MARLQPGVPDRGAFAVSVLLTDRALSPELANWAAARIRHVGAIGFGPNWSIGVALRGELVAVITFHDFQPQHGTLQLSMASATPVWVNRRVIGRILALVFQEPWGPVPGVPIRKLWVAIPSTAERTIGLNEALGLKREATLRHHFALGVHTVVCSMMSWEFRRLYRSENVVTTGQTTAIPVKDGTDRQLGNAEAA
jgi:hypothetical protein